LEACPSRFKTPVISRRLASHAGANPKKVPIHRCPEFRALSGIEVTHSQQ
jgi:hypothetical protein